MCGFSVPRVRFRLFMNKFHILSLRYFPMMLIRPEEDKAKEERNRINSIHKKVELMSVQYVEDANG